jgi:hypothetical protein
MLFRAAPPTPILLVHHPELASATLHEKEHGTPGGFGNRYCSRPGLDRPS